MKISYTVNGGFFNSFYEPCILQIPSLRAGDYRIFRVYLRENIQVPVINSKPQFDYYYWGDSGKPCTFRLQVTYDLPPVEEAAASQGLIQPSGWIPFLVNAYAYDHPAVYAYSFEQNPCEYQQERDSSVQESDFKEP